MNFERSNLLGPILDNLAANDQMLFQKIAPGILSNERAWQLRPIGSSIADPISHAFAEKLSERAEKIFNEMRRVLVGAYVDDFDKLREGLKAEWATRLNSMADIASRIRIYNCSASAKPVLQTCRKAKTGVVRRDRTLLH